MKSDPKKTVSLSESSTVHISASNIDFNSVTTKITEINLPSSQTNNSIDNCNGYYSDEIDSDVEAELYAQLHHDKVDDSLHKEIENQIQNSPNLPVFIPIEKTKALSPKSLAKLKSEGNWPVIGTIMPTNSPSKDKKPDPGIYSLSVNAKNQRGVVTMSDSECEIIAVNKKVPIVTLVDNSSEDDNCDSSVILEEVIELNLSNGIEEGKVDNHSTKSRTRKEKIDTLKRKMNQLEEESPVTKKRKRKKQAASNLENFQESPNWETQPSTSATLSSQSFEDNDDLLFPTSTLGSDSDENEFTPIKSKRQKVSDAHLWVINAQDKFNQNFRKTILYKMKSGINKIACHNCKEHGHLARFCPNKKKLTVCFVCGGSGHVGSVCLSPVCGVCLMIGHSKDFCLWNSDFIAVNCTICNLSGHLREECPDVWRRYHLTREAGKIVKSVPVHKVWTDRFCYNCGKNGHFGNECMGQKCQDNIFPSDFQIVNYNEPERDLPVFNDKYAESRNPQEEKLCKALYIHKHRLASAANRKFVKTCGFVGKNSRTASNLEFEIVKWGDVELGNPKLTLDELLRGLRMAKRKTAVAKNKPLNTEKKASSRKRRKLARKEARRLEKQAFLDSPIGKVVTKEQTKKKLKKLKRNLASKK